MKALPVFIILSMVVVTEQICCGNDRSKAFECCGAGECDFFCCKCDGNCRSDCSSWRKRRELTDVHNAQLRFITIDANRDGVITEMEGRDYLMNGTSSARVKRDIMRGNWFVQMDTNGDGIIQPAELDETLA